MTDFKGFRDSRMPILKESELTPEQLAFVEPMMKRSRGGLKGPMNVLARSPAFAEAMQAIGEFTRLESGGIPPHIQELAILINARFWDADYEWWVHVPKAIELGVSADAIADIRARRAPKGLKPDEHAVYEFLHGLYNDRKVSDDVYEKAKQAMGGEAPLIHLVGFSGHYGMLGMILNATETHTPGIPENELEILAD